MNENRCPLCSKHNLRVLQKINIKDLITLYMQAYSEDVSYLFRTYFLEFLKCNNCGLQFFNPSIVGDEYFYNVLQKKEGYYRDNKDEYDFASNYISSEDKVLEIGCGKGAFSKHIVYKTYTGLEFSKNAIALGKENAIEILNQSIQEHSIEYPYLYDIVCAFQVVEHIKCDELFLFLESSVKCLRPGGKLIISVPSADSYISKIINCTLNLPPHHQTRWKDKTLKKLTEILNLDLIVIKHEKLEYCRTNEFLSASVAHLVNFDKSIVNIKPSYIYLFIRSIFNRFGLIFKRLIYMTKPFGHSVTIVFEKPQNSDF